MLFASMFHSLVVALYMRTLQSLIDASVIGMWDHAGSGPGRGVMVFATSSGGFCFLPWPGSTTISSP